MRTRRIGTLLLILFISGLTVIVSALATKSFPLWAFIAGAVVVGIAVAAGFALLGRRDGRGLRFIVSMLATLGMLLWGYHALATRFNLIAFFDSYQEFVHLKMVLERGFVDIGARYPEMGVSPVFATSYPLYTIFAASVTVVSDSDPLLVAVLLPIAMGLFLFLSVMLFLRRSLRSRGKSALPLAFGLLAFVISPDMIYAATIFYHRVLALGLGFLTVYLVMKYTLGELRAPGRVVLILSILILPLAHSAYAATFTVLVVGILLLTLLFRNLPWSGTFRESWRSTSPVVGPAILILSSGFLWNFIVHFPSPLASATGGYVQNLLSPRYEAGDITRFQTQAEPFIPLTVRPEVWNLLLPLRDLLLYGPVLVVGIYLVVGFIQKRLSREEQFVFLAMIAVMPIVASDYAAGWAPLQFRFYAFPLVAYAFGVFFGRIYSYNRRGRLLTCGLVVFLVSMILIAPLTHIYYTRHLYDPTVDWQAVGFPSPSYRAFGNFVEKHPLGDGVILSDFPRLLSVTLPLEEMDRIQGLSDHFGSNGSYVVGFVGLRPTLGYHSPGTLSQMELVQTSIDHKYAKIVDAGPYSVHFNP